MGKRIRELWDHLKGNCNEKTQEPVATVDYSALKGHRSMVYGFLPEMCRAGWIKIPCYSKQIEQLWMSSDMWFYPIKIATAYQQQELPASLKELINEWYREAQEEKKSFKADWYEKNASLKFVWFGEFYQIYPSALGITSEQFSGYSVKMEQHLKMAGCPYMQYTGMLD